MCCGIKKNIRVYNLIMAWEMWEGPIQLNVGWIDEVTVKVTETAKNILLQKFQLSVKAAMHSTEPLNIGLQIKPIKNIIYWK